MRRFPKTLLPVVAWLVLAVGQRDVDAGVNALHDREAHAMTTLPVVVKLQPTGAADMGPATGMVQRNSNLAVKEAFEFHRQNTAGWECIKVVDQHNRPFLTVNITIKYEPSDGAYRISLEFLSLRGPASPIHEDWTRSFETDTEEIAAEAGRLAKGLVDIWVRVREPPCKLPVRVSGRTGNLERGRWMMPFEAEGVLSLDAGGSFQAALPYKFTVTMNFPPCGGTGSGDGTLEVSGSYNDGDATLRFTRMYSHSRGGTFTYSCPGETVSAPYPLDEAGLGAFPFTGGFTEASELSVPLVDGGKDSTRASPGPGWTREITAELKTGPGPRPCC